MDKYQTAPQLHDWLDMAIDDTMSRQLQALYHTVPDSQCPETCCDCCKLSHQDWRNDLAVMFPLYKVEYFSIARYVRDHFSAVEQEKLFAFREERPRICPFLDLEQSFCRLYPVRPYMCRTYGILSGPDILAAQQRFTAEIPPIWLIKFASAESDVICPKMLSVDETRKNAYVENRIRGLDIRQLHESNLICPQHPRERNDDIRKMTGRQSVGIWSWGGFNAMHASSDDWFERHFADYWRDACLVE